jgi:hypothetical protein
MRADLKSVGAPRIERCGNHWNVEWFAGDRFYSRCYKTWEECRKRAAQAFGVFGDHWKRAKSDERNGK